MSFCYVITIIIIILVCSSVVKVMGCHCADQVHSVQFINGITSSGLNCYNFQKPAQNIVVYIVILHINNCFRLFSALVVTVAMFFLHVHNLVP